MSYSELELPDGYDPGPYIEANEWKQARTFRENPHQYLLWDRASDLMEQAMLVKWIEVGGFDRTFKGRRYRYRELDGWLYWAMALTVNRRRIEDEPVEETPT